MDLGSKPPSLAQYGVPETGGFLNPEVQGESEQHRGLPGNRKYSLSQKTNKTKNGADEMVANEGPGHQA